MELKDVKAVVIKEAKYKEKDKMLTLVTDILGKISVAAKGIGSVTSKLSGGIAQNCVSEIEIRESSNGIYILSASKKLISFDNITKDLESGAYTGYILALCGDLFLEEEPFPALFRLLVNTLYMINEKKKNNELLKAIFELRSLAISGYGIDMTECACCDKKETAYINIGEGVCFCSECGKENPGIPLSAPVAAALTHIMTCEDKSVFSFNLGETHIKELSKISEEYVKYCMEKEYSALMFLRKVQANRC